MKSASSSQQVNVLLGRAWHTVWMHDWNSSSASVFCWRLRPLGSVGTVPLRHDDGVTASKKYPKSSVEEGIYSVYPKVTAVPVAP